ncbi:hypothetical protein ACLOJK_015256, partial [Asimina triloba]
MASSRSRKRDTMAIGCCFLLSAKWKTKLPDLDTTLPDLDTTLLLKTMDRHRRTSLMGFGGSPALIGAEDEACSSDLMKTEGYRPFAHSGSGVGLPAGHGFVGSSLEKVEHCMMCSDGAPNSCTLAFYYGALKVYL